MSMLRTWSTVGILVVSSLAGCQTTESNTAFKDITVETETNPKVNFGGYQTYAWAAAAAIVRDPDREWTPPDLDIGSEITFLVNREMRSRGMTEVVDNPDTLLIYAVGVDMKALNVTTDEHDGAERMEQVAKSGLTVVLADPATRQVMWVGSAEAEMMEERSTELSKQRLDHAITTMFKEFPR